MGPSAAEQHRWRRAGNGDREAKPAGVQRRPGGRVAAAHEADCSIVADCSIKAEQQPPRRPTALSWPILHRGRPPPYSAGLSPVPGLPLRPSILDFLAPVLPREPESTFESVRRKAECKLILILRVMSSSLVATEPRPERGKKEAKMCKKGLQRPRPPVLAGHIPQPA